jgi:hypothetical protein
MQPYFLPYIGYFQLIAAVDTFILYDNIKYTKKGWINRNRFMRNNKEEIFSLPLRKASDSLNIGNRELSAEFNRESLLSRLKDAYRYAPYVDQTLQLVEQIIGYSEQNLFLFLHNSIVQVCAHLCITTKLLVSSTIPIDHDLKGQDKVIALCKNLRASSYFNSIGGRDLYAKEQFSANGIELNFIKASSYEYPQQGASFIPWLSIIDVMMFNPLSLVQEQITNGYTME